MFSALNQRTLRLAFALFVGAVAGSAHALAPDLSEPRAAARTFLTAVMANDTATVRASSIGTDAENQTVDALGTVVAAQKKLYDAVKTKFGEQAQGLGQMRSPDFNEKLDEAEVQVSGDTATIVSKEPNAKPLKLRKMDGSWKVELSTMQLNNAQMPPDKMKQVGSAMDEVAGEVTAGKHATPQSAMMTLQQKIQAAVMGGAAPGGAAPGPSTQPSR
jgi:hypothetical protein